MIAAEVAQAFNAVNERKTWSARPFASNDGERVHFNGGRTNLISLVLECDTKRFQVRFNKLNASWGDYVTAIAKALYVTLTTLKVSGQPFDAPDDTQEIEIVATTANGTTYARWPGMIPPTVESATMPELLAPREPSPDIGDDDVEAIARGLNTEAVVITS